MRQKIYEDIDKERQYQDDKWGGPEHDDQHSVHDFIAFIAKYAGRAVETTPEEERKAMIQVAALAVAYVELLDRK